MPLKYFSENPNIVGHKYLFSVISPLTDSQTLGRLRSQMAKAEIPWEQVLQMANAYLMISALWVGLCKKKVVNELDNEVRDYLVELHALNVKRNHGLKHQAMEAVRALNRRDIVPMLIKGAVQLFQPLHEDFGTRIMTDLDILVPISQMDEAIRALLQLGYQVQQDPIIDWDAHHHAAPMVRPGDYGCIELHRRALGGIAERVLSTQELWAASEMCVHEGIYFKTPNTTHSVLMGFLHSQVAQGNQRMLLIDYKAQLDMVVMLSCESTIPDWRQIRNRIETHGLIPVFRNYLWTAHRVFNLPMPSWLRPKASTRAYFLICLATIRWELFDKWFEQIFISFRIRLRKHFGPLRQLFPFRLFCRKQ